MGTEPILSGSSGLLCNNVSVKYTPGWGRAAKEASVVLEIGAALASTCSSPSGVF